jgi:hypothetical protein
MLGGLQTYAVLGAETKDKLEQMGSLLEALKSISERELEGEALSQQDYDLIEGIGSQLSRLTTFSAATNQEVSSETDKRMAIVADVHTDANTRRVLEEGVGDAFRIFVVVPDGGASKATVGGVFSYYEFKQPMSDRLTDEAWQAMQTWPLRPAWTASFIAE